MLLITFLLRSNLLEKLLPLAIVSVMPAYAADRVMPQDNRAIQHESAMRELSPVQINAIRLVGRHILTAKKSGQEDATDNAELLNLRAKVDDLIATDIQLNVQQSITPQGQQNNEPRSLGKRNLATRDNALTSARTLSNKMRSHATSRMALADQADELSSKSAGLPIGKQRAEMFGKWADKLDAALADDGSGRLTKLQALRTQLQSTDGKISAAPTNRGTPTLQAMPSGFVPVITPNTGNPDDVNME